MTTERTRPHWHVDAKWIAGILSALVLALALFSLSAARATERETAVEVLALGMANMFSDSGLDDETEVEAFRAILAADPDGRMEPVPGLGIEVSAEDLEGLSAREARLHFFRLVAEPLYEGGADELARQATDPGIRAEIEEGMGPFGLLSADTHETLASLAYLSGFLSLLLLIPLVYFSHGAGRATSPGAVLAGVSFPGVITLRIASASLAEGSASPPSGESMGAMVAHIARSSLSPAVKAASDTYSAVFAVGVALLVTAAIWGLVRRLRSNDTRRSDAVA